MRAVWVGSRRSVLMLSMVVLLAPPPLAGAATSPRRAPPAPVLVELFTAQGCASCPQANLKLADLGDRDDVLALTFPVDYWDYLGWRDTFAKPEFTSRQRTYVAQLRLKEIYTPEIVVAGRAEAPGVDTDRINDLISSEAKRQRRAPAIAMALQGRRVLVGSGPPPSGGADVWLLRYDPARRDVRVRAGENAGKVVTQANVVRELTRLGDWNGRPRRYEAPEPTAAGLKTVVLVQGHDGGPVLALASG